MRIFTIIRELFGLTRARRRSWAGALALKLCVILPVALVAHVGVAAESGESTCRAVDWTVTGTRATDLEWMADYLGVVFPMEVDDTRLAEWKTRLLTTEVFSRVEATSKPREGHAGECVIHVDVDEKWTLIPVIRGAYGGGTPLRILGAYDTHAFGRLMTLGAETRVYGSAEPTWVVYGRLPRWNRGTEYIGLELWKEHRVRTLWDSDDQAAGEIKTAAVMARGQWYLSLGGRKAWQWGVDARWRREAGSSYEARANAPDSASPSSITFSSTPTDRLMPLGVLIHDDLAVENLSMEGTRLVVRAGPQFEQSSTQARVEAEVFRFWLSSEGWNLAAHVFAAQTSARTPDAQFWLGGLDSIRGVPDGAVYGTRAAYTNLELRKVTHRWRYLWMQPIVFFDAGGAGADWASARVDARSSVGTGVRFSIPQVYRLVVRADYAWSLDKPGKSGFSAGFNQFFQPYIPL